MSVAFISAARAAAWRAMGSPGLAVRADIEETKRETGWKADCIAAVSYTHLTLPTNREV